jgi:hypothetical protein
MAGLVSVVWRQTASSLGPPGRECGMACCGMYLLVRYWQSLVVSSVRSKYTAEEAAPSRSVPYGRMPSL